MYTTIFVCSQKRLSALSRCECKSVFCSVLRRVYVGRIYSLTQKNLKFDWSKQITWKQGAIVNQIGLSKRFSFEHICWYSNRKLVNTPALIFQYPCRSMWFIFTKQITFVLIWVIIYSYLPKFFKLGDLKALGNSQQNTCVGVSV